MAEVTGDARMYLGIDPGLSGALASLVVWPDGAQELQVYATPTVPVDVNGHHRRFYDVGQMFPMVPRDADFAYLEQQGARPGQGVVSTFSTGFGYGVWYAILTAQSVPFRVVTPQSWRKQTGILGGSGYTKAQVKRNARLVACRRFPTVPITLAHADAVMLAVAAALVEK